MNHKYFYNELIWKKLGLPRGDVIRTAPPTRAVACIIAYITWITLKHIFIIIKYEIKL